MSDSSCLHEIPHNSWGSGFLHVHLVYFSCMLPCTFGVILLCQHLSEAATFEKARYRSFVTWKKTHHSVTLRIYMATGMLV